MMKGRTLKAIGVLAALGVGAVFAQGKTLDAVKNDIVKNPAAWKIVLGQDAKVIDVIGAVDIATALQTFYKDVQNTTVTPKVTLESAELTYEEYAALKDSNDEWVAKGTYGTPVTLTVTYDKDKPETSFLLDEGGSLEAKVKTFDYKEDFGYYVEFDSIKVTLPFKELSVTSYEENQTVAGMSVNRRVTIDLYGKKYYVYWNSNDPSTIVLVAATGDVTLAEGEVLDLANYGYSGYKIKIARVLETGDSNKPYEITLQLIKDGNVVDEVTQRISSAGESMTLKDEEADKEIKLYNVKAAYHRFEEKYYVSFRFEAGTVKEGEDIDDYWTLDSSSAVTTSGDKADVTLVFTFKGWDKYEDTFGAGNKVLKKGDVIPGVLGGFEIAFPGLEEPEYGFLKVYVHGSDKYVAFEAKEGEKLEIGNKELSYLKVGYPESVSVTVTFVDTDSNTTNGYENVTISGLKDGLKIVIGSDTFDKDGTYTLSAAASGTVSIVLKDVLDTTIDTKSVDLSSSTSTTLSGNVVKVEQAKDTEGDLLTEEDWSVINKYIKADTQIDVYRATDDKLQYYAKIENIGSDTFNVKVYDNDRTPNDPSDDDYVTIIVDYQGSNAITDVQKQDEFDGVVEETVKYSDAPDYVTIKLPVDVIRAKLYAGSKIVGKKETRELKEGDIVYVEGKKYTVKEIEKVTVPQVLIRPLVGLAVLDTEVTPDMNKLIVVGGPAVNIKAAEFLGVSYPTYGSQLNMTEGEALIQVAEMGGQVAVLVYGWSGEDTRRAARAFALYLTEGKFSEAFEGATKVRVGGTVETPSVERVQ